MVGFLDFFGSSKRRSSLQLLDRTLAQLEVNPAYIDDGMRFAIYKWVSALAADNPAALDQLMRGAAEMISFCVLGPSETEALWGPAVRAEREARFADVLARGDEDTLDAMLIKLTFAKEIADPEIRARASLVDEN